MKKTILFLFFISYSIYSQSYKSLKVEYSTSVEPMLTKNSDNEKINALTDKINSSFNDKKFILQANSKGFVFNEEKTIQKDEKQEKIEKLANAIYLINSYYFSKVNNELFRTIDDVNLKVDNDFNWILLDDSKTIDNYVCYKAMCTINFTTRHGNAGSREITAWYTPQINFNYGPNGYMGLPGLILELEYNKTKLVAKKIEFFKEEIKIYIPNNKVITQDEFVEKTKMN